MSVPVSRDLLIINTAAFLRSFTFGLTGVVLGIYLFRVGLSSFNIGVVIAAGLDGVGPGNCRRYGKGRPYGTPAHACFAFDPGRDRCSCSRLDSCCSGSPTDGLRGNVERDRHGPLSCIFS